MLWGFQCGHALRWPLWKLSIATCLCWPGADSGIWRSHVGTAQLSVLTVSFDVSSQERSLPKSRWPGLRVSSVLRSACHQGLGLSEPRL